MLIVITIMLLLVTVGLTMMRPDVEGRRIREAARSLNVYLSSARNRAIETGTPCGVTFHNFATPGFALTADQCEVPPCYCGDTEQSTASVTCTGTTITANLCANDSPTNLLRNGDFIQFNNQGPIFMITTPNDSTTGYIVQTGSTWTLTCDTGGQLVPWGATALSVPYRIYRAPVKSAAESLQLPAATVVDLYASGVGNGYSGLTGPITYDVTVLFLPNGSIAGVYSGAVATPVTDPIFLLVGERARVGINFTAGNTNETTFTNYQDLKNLWVVINPQTGLVSTGPVAVVPSTDSQAQAISDSRALANQTQGMGGK